MHKYDTHVLRTLACSLPTNAGYSDVVAQAAREDQTPLMTWDPANPLNAVGPHKACPSQWVDHCFGTNTTTIDRRNVWLTD